MKRLKIIFTILAVIMLIFSIYLISRTYAVFYSEAKGDVSLTLARWDIKVNNTEVTKKTTQNFTISNLIIETNENVLSGKVAPNTRGSFNIVIDPTDTQVSIRYDIAIDNEQLNNYRMTISSINELSGNTTLVRTAASTYTGVIPLAKINGNYSDNIKIVFRWDNDDTKNNEDTAIGTVANNKTNIPISITFSQYLNEQITEYLG